MNFSFFRSGKSGASEIRASQMASKLKGRVNPRSDFENDICIYVLGARSESIEPKRSFYDLIDCGWSKISRIKNFTKGNIIVVSKSQLDSLYSIFKDREVIYIPQHHCNFDREIRKSRKPKIVGCIGGDSAVQWPHYAMKRLFEEIGLEWRFGHVYGNRQAVIDFYKDLDIQICYRPIHPRGISEHMNSLKLANAGSFGIPTISFPEVAYVKEWKNECLFDESIYGIVKLAKKLSEDPVMYSEMSEKVKIKAEEYHIDNIVKLYKQLENII